MRLIDADKDPCRGCKTKPFCSGSCFERMNWYATTIDPVIRGHWHEKMKYINCRIWHVFECSECHTESQTPTDYCPHCGAKLF